MFFRPVVSFFMGLWPKHLKRIAIPIRPQLDSLEERSLMATNLFAVGSSPGEAPLVRIYDSNSQHLIRQIQPFPSSFTGGVRIVLGDLNHDGQQDCCSRTGGWSHCKGI